MTTKKIIYICFISIAAILLNSYKPETTLGYYNTNASAPKGWYKITNRPVERGQYVILPVPDNVDKLVAGRGWWKPGVPLLKIVGAIEGDTVTITDAGMYINNIYMGPVLTEDKQGLPLPKLRGTFQIQPGQFLPISNYERSFDGRYFGPVPVSSIKYVVRPLLTD